MTNQIDGEISEILKNLKVNKNLSERVYGFGDSSFYQLGLRKRNSKMSQINEPHEIIQFKGIKIKQISTSFSHTIALDDDGNIYTFGTGMGGNLGHGLNENFFDEEPYPKKVQKIPKCKMIGAGSTHSLCLTQDGRLFVFGQGFVGQLGLGFSLYNVYLPTEIETKNIVTFIAVGSSHNMFITKKNEIYAFGSGKNGVLGNGKTENCYLPEKIEINDQIMYISCGTGHTLFLSCISSKFTFR